MDSSVHLRTATPADFDAISDLMELVFQETLTESRRAGEQSITETDRSLVAEHDDHVVGHATALTRDLTVPGAIVPAAHVTGVGVAPTHRRRGILTQLMRQQLEGLAAAGHEPIAVLWASESAIYPRFGYGPASSRLGLEITSREVRLTAPPATPPSGRLRLIKPPAAADEFAAVYERVRAERVGFSSRDEKWWKHLLADYSDGHGEQTGPRGVLYEDERGPAGYAIWRGESKWNEWGPDGVVVVRELVTDGPEAYEAIWRFLLGIDLTRTVKFWMAAVDEPVQYLVDDPGRLGRRNVDGLWIRILDLPAALEARQYATSLDAVVEVTDPLLPANQGRWRLSGGPDKVTCTRTDDAPDFACSITELGAAYLGGTSLAALAAAGRVRRLTGNLPSVAFGWHRQPNAIEVF
ncbi:GNAT family N-acetyltransferase [Actinoplanes sp. NPDC051411]|uniref:GNAT family N-acetyltransferase n=1 Tax=Actinoplanes sp. NPDC051411 TaxID=3155522 RepID=UPI003446D42C